MGSRQVSRTTIVATTPEKIFGLLADPAQHPLIDGSGTVRAPQAGARTDSRSARSSAWT